MTVAHEVEILDNQYVRNGVQTVTGHASFVDRNTLSITNGEGEVKCVDFRKALISVGTKPFRPDYIPFDGERIIDTDEILSLKTLPKSLTIIGAGVIGVEYATIFNALDIPVTLIEPRESMLDFIDQEIVDTFIHDLRARGIKLSFGRKAVLCDWMMVKSINPMSFYLPRAVSPLRVTLA